MTSKPVFVMLAAIYFQMPVTGRFWQDLGALIWALGAMFFFGREVWGEK